MGKQINHHHQQPVRLRERNLEPTRQAPHRGPQLSLPCWQTGTRRGCNPWAWQLLDNRRQLSIGAAANGGGTSSFAAKGTTSAPRRWGAARWATTRRDNQSLLRSSQSQGQPLGQFTCGRGGTLAKLNYMDIKTMLDRQQALNKKGKLTDREIKSLVKEWHDNRPE